MTATTLTRSAHRSPGLERLIGTPEAVATKISPVPPIPTRGPVVAQIIDPSEKGAAMYIGLGTIVLIIVIVVAIINGVAAAPFLVVVMKVSGRRTLMGDYVNGKFAKILGWSTAAMRGVAAVALFATGAVSRVLTPKAVEISAIACQGAEAAHESCWRVGLLPRCLRSRR